MMLCNSKASVAAPSAKGVPLVLANPYAVGVGCPAFNVDETIIAKWPDFAPGVMLNSYIGKRYSRAPYTDNSGAQELGQKDMDALNNIRLGMTAEQTVTVTPQMTVGHFVASMPQVYATPMMILHMEMASGSAIAAHLPKGFVSVGMDVNIRHLAATPVGRKVRALSRVVQIDRKSVVFDVEAWDDDRKIGDGTHRRGVVNVVEFEKRFGVKKLILSPG
jgi:fluoroacetyl-CoA thioesterase